MASESDPPNDDAPLASASEPDPWRDIPPLAPAASEPGPSTDDAPIESTLGDPAATPAPPSPVMPSVSSAQVMAAWSGLGQTAQLIIGGAIGIILVAILGAIVNAWASTGTFALILVTAGIAAAVAAWFTYRADASSKPAPIPLETIEFAAGTVALVLAVLRLIELLFDLDTLERFGGPIGAILTVAMVVAAGAVLVGALRRDPTLQAATFPADQGTRIAVVGFVLVVIGWALNLSIGFWVIGAATNSVALLTFGTVLVVVAPRWKTVLAEVPLAWVGAGFAIVGLLPAAGLWGELMDLGVTRAVLGLSEYGPFLLYVLAGGRDHRRWCDRRPGDPTRAAGRGPGDARSDAPSRDRRCPSAARCPAATDRCPVARRWTGQPSLNRGAFLVRRPRAAVGARRSRHSARRRSRRGSPAPSRPVPDRRDPARRARAAWPGPIR